MRLDVGDEMIAAEEALQPDHLAPQQLLLALLMEVESKRCLRDVCE